MKRIEQLFSSAEKSLQNQASRSPRVFAVVGWVLVIVAGCAVANIVLSSLGLLVEWVTTSLWLAFRIVGLALGAAVAYLALRTAIFAGKQIPHEDSETTHK